MFCIIKNLLHNRKIPWMLRFFMEPPMPLKNLHFFKNVVWVLILSRNTLRHTHIHTEGKTLIYTYRNIDRVLCLWVLGSSAVIGSIYLNDTLIRTTGTRAENSEHQWHILFLLSLSHTHFLTTFLIPALDINMTGSTTFRWKF